MTAIEMLQFSVGSLYPAVPPYERRILPLQHFQQVFLHLLSFFAVYLPIGCWVQGQSEL